jgi:spore coat polysaccharide biosynthesis predicted glycosyltransferase SpsG
MTRPRVTLLGDRGRSVGMGHAMRLRTVAAAVDAEGCDCKLLLCGESGPWDAILGASSWESGPADISHPSVVDRVLSDDPSVVVVDSYAIPRDSVARFEAAGARVVLIDDNGEHGGFPSSIIVNPNAHGADIAYPSVANQRIVAGIEWILIRPDVLALASQRDGPRSGWVVAIGGTDPQGLVAQVCELLPSGEPVVAAPSARGPLPPSDLAGALAGARGAVIAAGSTVWEAVFLGTPIVAVVTADNQKLVGMSLRQEFGIPVVDIRVDGWRERLAHSIIDLGESNLSAPCPIDGRGAERLSGLIQEFAQRR